ncbi:hypothetical protein Tco_0500715 [Tanacetum coccineum]
MTNIRSTMKIWCCRMSLEFVTQPLAATAISCCHNIYDVAAPVEETTSEEDVSGKVAYGATIAKGCGENRQ